MKQCNLAVLNGHWRRMSKSEARRKEYFPNLILWNVIDHQLAIEVSRSTRGNQFAVNQNALLNALKIADKWQGYIRFVEVDGTYVDQNTLLKVFNKVKNSPPNEGDYGSYWWIDPNGLATPPGGNSDCPV